MEFAELVREVGECGFDAGIVAKGAACPLPEQRASALVNHGVEPIVIADHVDRGTHARIGVRAERGRPRSAVHRILRAISDILPR